MVAARLKLSGIHSTLCGLHRVSPTAPHRRYDTHGVEADRQGGRGPALAQRSAQSSGHPEITPAHLVLALAEQPDTTTPALLAKGGSSAAQVAAAARSTLTALPRTSGAGVATPGLGQQALAVLTHANTLMQALGDAFLSTDVLLLALVEKGAVKGAGAIDAKAIEAEIPRLRGGHKVTSENPEASAEALEKYGTDLTQAARDGKLDPVIGRDAEIRRVVQVLSRRTKNNPVLIGEPGVGKTAVVEASPSAWSTATSRSAARQAPDQPRPRCHGGRGEVPWRVRGAPQGRPRGDQGQQRPDHHLHRRAAHRRRRRSDGRGCDGCRQHAQAPGAR